VADPELLDFARTEGAAGIAEWRREHLRRRLELGGANLGGADLVGANLGWANLAGTDLTLADLTLADLAGANLAGANLSGANLTRASLHLADLIGAILAGANLSGADLEGANLIRADLAGTDLGGTRNLEIARNLDQAHWDDHTRWPEGFTPPEPLNPEPKPERDPSEAAPPVAPIKRVEAVSEAAAHDVVMSFEAVQSYVERALDERGGAISDEDEARLRGYLQMMSGWERSGNGDPVLLDRIVAGILALVPALFATDPKPGPEDQIPPEVTKARESAIAAVEAAAHPEEDEDAARDHLEDTLEPALEAAADDLEDLAAALDPEGDYAEAATREPDPKRPVGERIDEALDKFETFLVRYERATGQVRRAIKATTATAARMALLWGLLNGPIASANLIFHHIQATWNGLPW